MSRPGVALAGSQVSSFGYNVTQIMEQAFSTPRMTEQGYGAALETLKRVRLATIAVQNLNMITAPTPDADLPRSWQQFIADCPLKGLQNENRLKTNFEIWNTPLMTQGLKFESDLWGTRLDLTRPYTEPTCSEAFDALIEYTQLEFLPYFKEVMARKLRYANVAELETKVADALAALGLTASADDYLLTSALSVVYFQAVRQRHAEDFQPAYATAVDDAVRQRNAQWLADESLFQQYMRPMITFLEGFIFAMTPFLVLLLGLGGYGIKVIFGFLITLIWITTWMPVLAIINFFQHFVAAAKMASLAENGAGVDTMAGLFQADSIIQTYLAVGGNMAAAVPALTATFLFFGSRAFGANLFAQRLSSGTDTFKEEKAAPDSYHAGAMVNLPSPFTQAPQAGYTAQTGLPLIAPSYSWSNSQAADGLLGPGEERGGQPQLCRDGGAADRRGGGQQRERRGRRGVQHPRGCQPLAELRRGQGLGRLGLERERRQQGHERPDPGAAWSTGSPPASRSRRWPKGYGRAGQVCPRRHVSTARAARRATTRRRSSSGSPARWRITGATTRASRRSSARPWPTICARATRIRSLRNRSVQSDQGLQRQASEVLAANREYRNVQTASAELGDRVNLSEPDLVGMIMRDEAAREYVGREAMLMGLSGKVQEIELGIYNQYPTQAERQVAAEVRALSRVGPVEKQLFLEDLGEKLLLTKARELGDAQAHAGIGARSRQLRHGAGQGRRHGRAGGRDRSGSQGRAGAARTGGRGGPRPGDEPLGREQCRCWHHQDINRVEAQIGREATDQASEDLGSDGNLATPVEDIQKAGLDWAKEQT